MITKVLVLDRILAPIVLARHEIFLAILQHNIRELLHLDLVPQYRPQQHDLAVIEHVSDRVMVLYLGRVMEIAPVGRIYAAPRHPYTEALLSAAPQIDGSGRKRIILKGEQPSPANPPSGCVFRTRCPYALPDCTRTVPPLTEVAQGHFKACLRDDVP